MHACAYRIYKQRPKPFYRLILVVWPTNKTCWCEVDWIIRSLFDRDANLVDTSRAHLQLTCRVQWCHILLFLVQESRWIRSILSSRDGKLFLGFRYKKIMTAICVVRFNDHSNNQVCLVPETYLQSSKNVKTKTNGEYLFIHKDDRHQRGRGKLLFKGRKHRWFSSTTSIFAVFQGRWPSAKNIVKVMEAWILMTRRGWILQHERNSQQVTTQVVLLMYKGKKGTHQRVERTAATNGRKLRTLDKILVLIKFTTVKMLNYINARMNEQQFQISVNKFQLHVPLTFVQTMRTLVRQHRTIHHRLRDRKWIDQLPVLIWVEHLWPINSR